MPDAPAASEDTVRRWFELLNEVGIIAQLSRALFEEAQDDGLTLPQFTVLNHLVRVGEGRSPLDLARAFQVPKPSMTNTLAGLEARGLIEARPNPKDGRSKRLYLTAAGRLRREAAIAALAPAVARLDAGPERDAVIATLPALAALRKLLDASRG